MTDNIILINDIQNTVKFHTNDFIHFLVDKKVITIGIGLILASQISVLVNNITTSMINPIIHRFIQKNQTEKLEQLKVEVYGIEFEAGKLISGVINFIFILFALYLIYRIEVKLTEKINGSNKVV